MTQTAIALYPTSAEANDARRALTTAGHDREQIEILEGSQGAASSHLDKLALSAHDAAAYREGIRRGNSLLLVTGPDDQMNEIVSTMERYETLNIQERSRTWQQEGWHPDNGHSGNNDEMIGDNDHMIGEDAEPQPGTVTPDK